VIQDKHQAGVNPRFGAADYWLLKAREEPPKPSGRSFLELDSRATTGDRHYRNFSDLRLSGRDYVHTWQTGLHTTLLTTQQAAEPARKS